MEKSLCQLLRNRHNLSAADKDEVANRLAKIYLPIVHDQAGKEAFLNKLVLTVWSPEELISEEGSIIQEYFFLLEGTVELYRLGADCGLELVGIQKVKEPIGEWFYSKKPRRTTRNINGKAISRGFKVNKAWFDKTYNKMIADFESMQQLVCLYTNLTQLPISQKDLFYSARLTECTYKTQIKSNGAICILLYGECLMKRNTPLNQPFVRLNRFDCIGAEALFPDCINEFSYEVTTDKLCMLELPVSLVKSVPVLLLKIKDLHEAHMNLEYWIRRKDVSLLPTAKNSRVATPLIKLPKVKHALGASKKQNRLRPHRKLDMSALQRSMKPIQVKLVEPLSLFSRRLAQYRGSHKGHDMDNSQQWQGKLINRSWSDYMLANHSPKERKSYIPQTSTISEF